MQKLDFLITTADVEILQSTVSRTDDHADYVLTDNDSPLDLLCRAFDLWTENEVRENNIDYISTREGEALDRLDYETAFLATLSDDDREHYAQELQKYDEDLQQYKEDTREKLRDGDTKGLETLDQERSKERDRIYKNLMQEYLNGDRSSQGVLAQIQKELGDTDEISFEYDRKTGDISIHISREDGDDPRADSKGDFLQILKYKTIENIKKKQAERQKRRDEREAQEIRKKEHQAREIQKKREKILSFNQAK
jgi:hypothetical protein